MSRPFSCSLLSFVILSVHGTQVGLCASEDPFGKKTMFPKRSSVNARACRQKLPFIVAQLRKGHGQK